MSMIFSCFVTPEENPLLADIQPVTDLSRFRYVMSAYPAKILALNVLLGMIVKQADFHMHFRNSEQIIEFLNTTLLAMKPFSRITLPEPEIQPDLIEIKIMGGKRQQVFRRKIFVTNAGRAKDWHETHRQQPVDFVCAFQDKAGQSNSTTTCRMKIYKPTFVRFES